MCRLDEGNLPEDMDLMEDYLQLVNHEYKRWQEDKEALWAPQGQQRPPPFSVSQLSLIEIRCATPRCTFYVSVDTQPHCHECFEKRQAGRKLEPNVAAAAGPGVVVGTTAAGVTLGGPAGADLEGGRSRGAPPAPTTVDRALVPSPRSAPPTAPSLSLYSETHAMKCKTPGCLFTLSVEHDGLCERCFAARQNPPPAPANANATHLNGPAHHGWSQWTGGRERDRDWERERERERDREAERCSMCRQEAFRIFNGLCPPCMQRTAAERGEPQQPVPPRIDPSATASSVWTQLRDAERSAASGLTAWHVPTNTNTARLCKRSGCPFFGTQEKLGFCTICYVDYQTNHRKYTHTLPFLCQTHLTPQLVCVCVTMVMLWLPWCSTWNRKANTRALWGGVEGGKNNHLTEGQKFGALRTKCLGGPCKARHSAQRPLLGHSPTSSPPASHLCLTSSLSMALTVTLDSLWIAFS